MATETLRVSTLNNNHYFKLQNSNREVAEGAYLCDSSTLILSLWDDDNWVKLACSLYFCYSTHTIYLTSITGEVTNFVLDQDALPRCVALQDLAADAKARHDGNSWGALQTLFDPLTTIAKLMLHKYPTWSLYLFETERHCATLMNDFALAFADREEFKPDEMYAYVTMPPCDHQTMNVLVQTISSLGLCTL
jgi:hypothetical protein